MSDTYNMSDYLEGQLYDHLFRSSTFSKPSTLYFCLCSGIPNSANTGINIPELPNANGYSRVGYPVHNSGWQAKPTDAGGANTLPILFPTFTGNAGYVSGIAITDSPTIGAGNMLFWGSITIPRVIFSGDAPIYNSGSFVVDLD